MAFRIAQVSDCHISASATTPYRGLDARAALTGLLDSVAAFRPDLLLVTGDLSEDGSAAAYDWLAAQFATLEIPVLALPGNHDDASLLRSRFPGSPVHRPEVHTAGDWRLVLINSTVPGQVSGHLDTNMLEGLDTALGESPAPVLVALHHQPLPIGSPWIDKYPLQKPETFWAVLSRHPQVRAVTWGHVHQAFEGAAPGAGPRIPALGSPSSASNSLPGAERFTPDPAGPAFRWFELRTAGEFETGIRGTT